MPASDTVARDTPRRAGRSLPRTWSPGTSASLPVRVTVRLPLDLPNLPYGWYMTSLRTGGVQGLVAVVTGAARGQGRAHAVRLAEEGAALVLLDACAAVPDLGYPPATDGDLDETVALAEKAGARTVAG